MNVHYALLGIGTGSPTFWGWDMGLDTSFVGRNFPEAGGGTRGFPTVYIRKDVSATEGQDLEVCGIT